MWGHATRRKEKECPGARGHAFWGAGYSRTVGQVAGNIAQKLGARFLRVEEERTGYQVKGTCLAGPGGEV